MWDRVSEDSLMCVHYEGESYLYSVFVTLARAGPGLGEGECKVGQTLRGCLRVQWENTGEKVVIYQECRVGLLLSSCLKADC